MRQPCFSQNPSRGESETARDDYSEEHLLLTGSAFLPRSGAGYLAKESPTAKAKSCAMTKTTRLLRFSRGKLLSCLQNRLVTQSGFPKSARSESEIVRSGASDAPTVIFRRQKRFRLAEVAWSDSTAFPKLPYGENKTARSAAETTHSLRLSGGKKHFLLAEIAW